MKVGIFGCKGTTKFLIESLIWRYKIDYLITIDKDKGDRFSVADYCDLREFAEKNNIEVYDAKRYNLSADISNIVDLNIDIAFVVGWQRLIPSAILENMSIGAFGMHGSSMDLPLGRGRSPMNWSILEGRKCYYANLFKYDAGADSGNILDTFKFNITDNDTGETMHFKQTLAMIRMIENNFYDLMDNNITLKKQKDVTPTYYPKRCPSDSLIDWDMDVNDLDRFIRAVTKPFNGAYCYTSKPLCSKVIIYNSQIFDTLDLVMNKKKMVRL